MNEASFQSELETEQPVFLTQNNIRNADLQCRIIEEEINQRLKMEEL